MHLPVSTALLAPKQKKTYDPHAAASLVRDSNTVPSPVSSTPLA